MVNVPKQIYFPYKPYKNNVNAFRETALTGTDLYNPQASKKYFAITPKLFWATQEVLVHHWAVNICDFLLGSEVWIN